MSRKQNNQALEIWDDVLTSVNAMDARMREILVRDRFDTDKAKSPLLGDAKGSQPPGHSDPVGDEAVEVDSKYLSDPTHRQIVRLGLLLRVAKALLNKLADLSDTDVRKRAVRSKEICLACGDDILVPTERVKAGFDEKCYKRWARLGRPNRPTFIAMVQAERTATAPADTPLA